MKIGAIVAALACVSSTALAERVNLFIFENAGGANTTGLDLWVDVLDAGSSTIDFVFHNDSTIDSFVTAIYFEENALTEAMVNPQIMNGAGTDFEPGASPPNPPGSIAGFGGAWNGTLFGADAKSPPPKNGINPGEQMTVRFDIVGQATYSLLLSALKDGEWRIAEHIQGLSGGLSVWGTTPGDDMPTVPLPPAAWAGLAGLGGVMTLRSMRHRLARR